MNLTDAIALTKRQFLMDTSGSTATTRAYVTTTADYAAARERWPALMAVAASIFVLQHDAGADTRELVSAMGALDINKFPEG